MRKYEKAKKHDSKIEWPDTKQSAHEKAGGIDLPQYLRFVEQKVGNQKATEYEKQRDSVVAFA